MSSNPLNLHPVDWFNFYGNFADIFKNQKGCHMITENEAALYDSVNPTPDDLNKATFVLVSQTVVTVKKNNAFNLPVNSHFSKFTILTAVKFKNDQAAAASYINYELIGNKIPYIRVRCDYMKIIEKEDRYGGIQTNLVSWKKEEIKQDHSKSIFNQIPKFDDFVIVPDNKNYKPIIKNCYNLYSKFPHKPHTEAVTESDIPVTMGLLKHLFGDSEGRRDHLKIALIYFKVLYEHPKQILPILCPISKKRNTGKTTFINWVDMIFGNNFVLISPEELTDKFNADFATKNILATDEMFTGERSHAVEKIKFLATSKKINVSEKFVSKYSIPFFGKLILCSNKVTDFMRIDSDEIRFWVRRIPEIKGKKNTKIEAELFAEIPKFLKYLEQLPPVDLDNGERMVLSKEDIFTEDLLIVQEESRSQLYKELEILIDDWFNLNPHVEGLYATAKDIKDYWFKSNNQISAAYIRKVLKDEVEIMPQVMQKYKPFNDGDKYPLGKTGTPYYFPNKNYEPPLPEF